MSQFKIISSYINQEEIYFDGEEELRKALGDFSKFGNNVVLIEFPGYGKLTLGIGIPYGFVEYMNNDGTPPYLLATIDMEEKGNGEVIEFDSGGTPTPILQEYCLPFDLVVDIAVFIFKNKNLPETINWLEV